MEDRSLSDYLNGSLEIVRWNCEAYQRGCRACYRVLAGQLRILLCDHKREHNRWHNNSLVFLLFPEITIARLHEDWPVHPNAHPVFPDQLTSTDTSRLPLQSWLEQIIVISPTRQMNIRNLIKLISEKDGGAHVDLTGQAWMDTYYIAETIYHLARVVYTEVTRFMEG